MKQDEATRLRAIFALYLEHGRLIRVVQEFNHRGWRMKERTKQRDRLAASSPFTKNRLSNLRTKRVQVGKVEHGR